jgi:hypothetical protein
MVSDEEAELRTYLHRDSMNQDAELDWTSGDDRNRSLLKTGADVDLYGHWSCVNDRRQRLSRGDATEIEWRNKLKDLGAL